MYIDVREDIIPHWLEIEPPLMLAQSLFLGVLSKFSRKSVGKGDTGREHVSPVQPMSQLGK